jgi:hypothetical protein
VEVVISEEAKSFVQERGGAVFVRAAEHKCCGGALVILDASTKTPRDALDYVAYPAEGVDVYYHGHPRGVPNQLVIELRGLIHRHLAAYKDGCVFPL